MNFAIKKRYVPASTRFDDGPRLKVMRRDEFTPEEYRKLHTVGRQWIKAATRSSSVWYRTVTYNFILIMCNTGMRKQLAALHPGMIVVDQPFFHCWFLSVPQLLVLLDGVNGPEEFRASLWKTRHVTTGTSDFCFDLAFMQGRFAGGSSG